jgi:glycosyltransferase involved in cell wall biosynthesis
MRAVASGPGMTGGTEAIHHVYGATGEYELELTILMPCLNEAETIATCVTKAVGWLGRAGVKGEVVVADNGSTDGSQYLAVTAGARVVAVPRRGYGAALLGGIEAARGRYVIMGDADDSYDFTALDPFLHELRDGADLVMGNRFAGGIEPGAMPFLHRYLGNPVLSGIGRLFFRLQVRDFHCGLRGFRRNAVRELGLVTTGMEFASELVVKAGLRHFDIRETPTTLCPDGRSRKPHLRKWPDGWRHLRFLLLYSPRWLFLVPGFVFFAIGLALTCALVIGPIRLGDVELDVSALVYASAMTIVGFQAVTFALFTKIYAVSKGFLPPDDRVDELGGRFRLERGLAIGLGVFLVGIGAAIASLIRWEAQGWGDLNPGEQLRVVVPASLGLVLGSSMVLASFFLSILGMDKKIDLS